MNRFATAKFAFALAALSFSALAQTPPPAAPPAGAASAADVAHYVQESKKAGMDDREIQEAAIGAGFTAQDVAREIAKLHPAAPATPATGSEAKPGEKPAGPTVVESAPPPPATAAPPAPATPTKPVRSKEDTEYVIGGGDILQISVWGERDASAPSVVVRPDGKISMPLLKDVMAAGLTPMQLEKFLTDQFTATNMIKAPDVTVVVTQINSKKIYMTGAIKKEGPLPFSYQLTVLQAISEAGGLTEFAKRKKIYVMRNEGGKQVKFEVKYDDLLKGQHMETNIPLKPGDMVVIPQ